MTGIGFYAKCDINGTEKPVAGPTCPPINVKDPDATCEYTPSICGGVAREEVKGIASLTISNSAVGATHPRCIYVTNITNIFFQKTADQQTTINGVPTEATGTFQCGDGSLSGMSWLNQSCATALPAKVDDGYYIYTSSQYAHFNALHATNTYGSNRHPNCP